LEKLINSAQRKRKDNGVFELTWTNNSMSVSIDLKIISSPQTAAGGASTQSQSQGYRGMRLPATVTLAPVPAATPSPNSPASAASSVGGSK
jgi:type VI secretion system protein ImpL